MDLIKDLFLRILIMLTHALGDVGGLTDIDFVSILKDIEHRPVIEKIIIPVIVARKSVIRDYIKNFLRLICSSHVVAPLFLIFLKLWCTEI